MLSKEQRMRKVDFQFISQKKIPKKVVHTPFFSLHLYEGEGKTKWSVIVSKKVQKQAVKRNHLRRAFYEIIRNTLPQVSGYNFGVIFLKKKVYEKTFSDLKVVFSQEITCIKNKNQC